jgi:Glycosyltransferase family 87
MSTRKGLPWTIKPELFLATLRWQHGLMGSAVYKLLVIGFAVVIAVCAVVPIRHAFHGSTQDYGLWYEVGQTVLSGGDIYTKNPNGTFRFMYPPTAAVLLAPLSVLGQVPLVIVLVLVNTAAWIASVLLAVHLATGRALRQHLLLYLVPALVSIPYAWDTYLLGQPNLLLLACMLGAFVCLRRHCDWGTGLLIAFAAAIKAFPILAVVYLLYRHYWKAAAFVGIFLVVFLLLLPAPFRGFQQNLRDLDTWNKGMALHYQADSIAQRPGRGYSHKNHSLIAVANRLLRPVNANEEKNNPLYVNVVTLSFRDVNVVIGIVSFGLCLWFVSSMPRRKDRTEQTDAVEWAMLLIMVLIFSPLSFTYFYVWLLYPLAVAVHVALTAPKASRERSLMLLCVGASVVLLSLSLLSHWSPRGEAMGNILSACLLLLFGLGWVLRRPNSLPAPITPPHAIEA